MIITKMDMEPPQRKPTIKVTSLLLKIVINVITIIDATTYIAVEMFDSLEVSEMQKTMKITEVHIVRTIDRGLE